MLQEISKEDKWDIAPLKYPFGNGINFRSDVFGFHSARAFAELMRK